MLVFVFVRFLDSLLIFVCFRWATWFCFFLIFDVGFAVRLVFTFSFVRFGWVLVVFCGFDFCFCGCGFCILFIFGC